MRGLGPKFQDFDLFKIRACSISFLFRAGRLCYRAAIMTTCITGGRNLFSFKYSDWNRTWCSFLLLWQSDTTASSVSLHFGAIIKTRLVAKCPSQRCSLSLVLPIVTFSGESLAGGVSWHVVMTCSSLMTHVMWWQWSGDGWYRVNHTMSCYQCAM